MRESDPAVAFLTDVLAGRGPLDLPGDASDRDRAVELLHYHRLVGLWFAETRGLGRDHASSDRRDPRLLGLEAEYVGTALHSSLVVESAQRARQALSVAGVPSLTFKGAALLQDGTYPDAGARSVEDADVLVPRRAVGDGIRALQEAGFEPWVEWDEGRVEWLPAFTFTDRNAPEGMDLSLDLHWGTPYSSFRSAAGRPGEDLWEGADLERGMPAVEPHFLILVEHFLKHLRVVAHLRGIGDLVRTLPRVSRPDVIAELAERRGSARGLRVVLAFLRDRVGVSVPEELLSRAGVSSNRVVGHSGFMSPGRLVEVPGPERMGRIQGLVFQWSLTASPLSVVRDAYDVIMPPREWLDQRYADVPGRWGARRGRHFRAVTAWLLGRGVSPLSPNQEFEG